MTMPNVDRVETQILDALRVQSPISAARREDLIHKIVERINIEPGTTSNLVHSTLTAELALHVLETDDEIAMGRNQEGRYELRRIVPPEVTEGLGAVGVRAEGTGLDWSPAFANEDQEGALQTQEEVHTS